MSSYGTPFIAPANKRFAIVPARLFNRTKILWSQQRLSELQFPTRVLTATASIRDKKKCFVRLCPRGGGEKNGFYCYCYYYYYY